MYFGIETLPSWQYGIAAALVLTALALTGCRTYYGYGDIVEEVGTPGPSGEPRDVRYYAVVTDRRDNTTVKCFRTHVLPKRALVEKRIVGRKEWYRDYDAWYYFENPPYNAGWNKDAWAFSKCEFFWPKHVKEESFLIQSGLKDKALKDNPLFYLFPLAGQAALVVDGIHAITISCYDVPVFLGAGMIDACLFMARCCWTGISIPCAWLWGRTFGSFGSWHLETHKPGVLRMTGYLPFVNFFAIQTPPYMTDGSNYGVEVKYDEGDQTVLERKLRVKLTPEQIALASCKVSARVLCGSGLCGSGEYTADAAGVVDLTELVRNSAAKAPAKHLTLELAVRDDSGTTVLTRRVDFTVDQVLPRQAERDLRAYRNADTDCLNKLLLSRRSHAEWHADIFNDEFALPEVGN